MTITFRNLPISISDAGRFGPIDLKKIAQVVATESG
jgi:hypothetical protein